MNACHFVVSCSFLGLHVSVLGKNLLGLVDLYSRVDIIVFVPVHNFCGILSIIVFDVPWEFS